MKISITILLALYSLCAFNQSISPETNDRKIKKIKSENPKNGSFYPVVKFRNLEKHLTNGETAILSNNQEFVGIVNNPYTAIKDSIFLYDFTGRLINQLQLEAPIKRIIATKKGDLILLPDIWALTSQPYSFILCKKDGEIKTILTDNYINSTPKVSEVNDTFLIVYGTTKFNHSGTVDRLVGYYVGTLLFFENYSLINKWETNSSDSISILPIFNSNSPIIENRNFKILFYEINFNFEKNMPFFERHNNIESVDTLNYFFSLDGIKIRREKK